MEQSNSLLLNEKALDECPEAKKPVFVYEWLRYLDRILPATQKSDIRGCQQKLVQQLSDRILAGPGPPTRQLLAKCIATVYTVGDTYSLFQTINACNDALKGKDDSPSQLPAKLAAVACLGAMYESLGRMVGRSYEETTQLLVKWLKNAESQGRAEIMLTFAKMVYGLGNAGASIHKELYKHVRTCITDRGMPVRVAAVTCLTALIPEMPFLYTNELENVASVCFKALEGSNYEVRQAIAKLLGVLLSTAHEPPKISHAPGKPQQQTTANSNKASIDDCLNLLGAGFLRGGIGGFLKGGTTATANLPKEIRIGVTLAYVELAKLLGPVWLERNLAVWMRHLIDLMSKVGTMAQNAAAATYIEVVNMRRCVAYALRATVGAMLAEKAQVTACKEIGTLLAEQLNTIDYNIEPGVDRVLTVDVYCNAQATICALQELACLVKQIGSSVTPLFVEASGIMEPVFASLLHPVPATRIAGAWCLRAVTYSVPGQLTPLIDRCLSRLEHMKASPDAISGYSLALSALLAGSADCPLGVPHGKYRQVFTVGEDMLKTATQTTRLASVKTQAGWMLLASVMSLGPSVVKPHVPRMLLLWKNAFPRSAKEAEAEKQRGDSFTWGVTLDARSGALAAMENFCRFCPELLSDEVLRKILHPIESCLSMIGHMAAVLRGYSNQLRHQVACVRLRLYNALGQIAPKYYENLFAPMLREVVADITLADNSQSQLSTSLITSLCQGVDKSLLGTWLQDTDQRMIEEQLHPTHSGVCGALENDALCLISRADDPEPLPVSVATIDGALLTYGRIFPLVPAKHKLQMSEHFAECIKSSKPGARQQAIQLNVFAALLTSLKAMGEQKVKLEGETLQKSAINLVVGSIGAPSAVLRCAAAEALGRLAQAVGDPQFVAGMAQFSFDKLKTCRDATNRTGYSLALGCLHRYVGSLGSGQHLNTSVSILLALAQDNSSPVVQAWSLRALELVADTGGGMFRGYVEPSLSLCLRLMLTTPFSSAEVVQCLGKLVSALITTVGPELQSVGAIEGTRSSFLIVCAMMFDHPDPTVKAEAIACLQQLHLFAPRFVQLDRLVTQLCTLLKSSHLVLRKAAISCLRQLLQREAKEVREHAQSLVPQGMLPADQRKDAPLPESGLEGAFFAMLDTETDKELRQHIKEALTSLVQATASDLLSYWLTLCKDILGSTSADLRSPLQDEKVVSGGGGAGAGLANDDNEDGGDDDETLQAPSAATQLDKQKLSPRWPTRVFAAEIVQKLIALCETERAHLDLALAKELQLSNGGKSDYLVLHLSDLVRMAFMAATSDNTGLRLAGLSCLQDVINRFSTVPEPEFPGHVILEQFQAQVGAALRPAFAAETPSHVTAAACQVCSTWIGSGVARDLNDLRRVHQLLVSSLAKLKHGSISTQLYSESAATLEKLAILKAWAEVYIVAVQQHDGNPNDYEKEKENKEATTNGTRDDNENSENAYAAGESLLSLVTPELTSLVGHWLAALRDSALLSLPTEFTPQLPSDGGAYYTPESVEACKQYYRSSWPPILLAAATWLRQNDFDLPANCEVPKACTSDSKEARFHLMLGSCIEALVSSRHAEGSDTVQLCLRTLKNLVGCPWSQRQLMTDVSLPIELINVLHRLILTRDSLQTQLLCMKVLDSVLDAADIAMKENSDSDGERSEASKQFVGNEGDEDGQLVPGSSLAFATMEACLCLLVRQIPQVNAAAMKGKSMGAHFRKYNRLPIEAYNLIKIAVTTLTRIPLLCSDKGSLSILPSVLYLVVGVLRESSRIDSDQLVPDLPPGHVTAPAAAALQALRAIVSRHPSAPPGGDVEKVWASVIRSAFVSVISLADTVNGENTKVDLTAVLLAAAVFVTSAPKNVVVGDAKCRAKCVQLFRLCLNDESLAVEQKCLQSLPAVFLRKEVSAAFIKDLAPLVVAKIKRYLPDRQDSPDAAPSLDDSSLPVVQESLKCLETLMTVAENDKRLNVVSMVVQMLALFLCESPATNYRSLSAAEKRMHDFALARLNVIGPAHPDHFKRVLAAFPDTKARLEAAIRYSAGVQTQQQQQMTNAARKATALQNATAHEPTIKLKMDFSAFTKKE
uniref:HEAT repeat-containing protein 5B n=1 Tax=Plectus sambesii TaxID=2011161 RepID=A0A914XTE3_9BILA